METPAPKTVTTALVAGLVAGVVALLVIEVIDLVISRIAHHQSKQVETEVWNYYAVRDATESFLGNLHATITANGDDFSGGAGRTERRADSRADRADPGGGE